MPSFQQSPAYQEVLNFHFPRYAQLPELDLYMDQVLGVVNQRLSIFAAQGEKLLTAAMVNNYVKKKLLPPAVGKRYEPGHVALLFCICTLKPVLSISEIASMLALQCQLSPQRKAYDQFAELLEQALRCVFASGQYDAPLLGAPPADRLIGAAIFSFANKLYLQKYLAYHVQQEQAQAEAEKEKDPPSPKKKAKAGV